MNLRQWKRREVIVLLGFGHLSNLLSPLLAANDGWPARIALKSEFAAAGTIAKGGAVSVSGYVSCEQSEDVEVAVKLTQGRVTAQSQSRGRCDAPLYRFTVQAQPQGGRFGPGMAQSCGHASFIQNGQTVAIHEWCREGGVMLIAGSN